MLVVGCWLLFVGWNVEALERWNVVKNNHAPTIHHPLPITHYPLPITHYPLPTN
uniref:hypothetical protein n=1 Tax=Hassallia byssoidea TaxID=482630 RepID=UPI000AB68D58|nr:hypothetical protein [Hassalia byssoidea]